jgi:hypothetical protein
MRELARSMMSYTWAMSMFGVQQAINMVTPVQGADQSARTAQAFDNVTDATTKTFDGSIMQAYKTGNSLQAGMIDMMFGGFMAGGCDPSRLMRMGSDAMRKMSGMASRPPAGASSAPDSGPSNASASSGSDWGPMPR